MLKTANTKDRYKPGNLFQGSYGSVVYVPDVDLLSQLSLDPSSLNEKLKSTKTRKSQEKETGISTDSDFGGSTTIKVQVPPPPSDAMINRRTNKTFPLGTKTDPSTGEELRLTGPVTQERTIRNQILYTDTAQGLVYFVDDSGMLDSFHVGTHLSPLSDNRNLCLSVLDTKIPVTGSFRTDSGLRQTWNASSVEEMFYIDPKDASQAAKARRDRLRSMSNVEFDKGKGVPLFMYAKNKDFREFVNSELRALESKFKQGTASVKPSEHRRDTMLGEYYAQLIVAVLFSEKHSEFFAGMVSEENHTMSVDPADAPEVPHIRADTRFLPHQSYALSFLKERKTAMVDADPGAGKTLMLLADILDKMNRGLVTRPAIVMPNSLLSQQKAEFEEWTQGTMNFIVLNTQTVKESDPEAERIQRGPKKGLPSEGSKNAGLTALTELIKAAPKNTIILTSYEWLRGGQEDQIKTASGVRYRNPNWLTTRIGVDMLVLDESHKVRINASGKASGQAEAILQMSSMVPFKRCYTGTVTPSSPDDVFLQMSFLDPSVLGSRKQFTEKYALSKKRNGKVEEFKPGAIKQIREVVGRRTGVSIRRSAWLSELPTMKLAYHKAVLSPAQRVVYERILDRIIKEELGLEYDPSTGMVRPSGASPGSVGRDLQKQMQAQYASNPVARDRVSQWQAPTSIALPEYDSEIGDVVDVDYDVADDEEAGVRKFDVSDPAQKAAFKAAQERIAKLWQRYEIVQGDSEDAPEIEDFTPLLTKFIAIDKFLNYPPADEFGQHFLAEDSDRESPKIKVLDALLARHFADPNNGKVIIFTHFRDVAKHISETIQMASKAVYYDAQQTKALTRFKRDDSVQILVAVEQSIQEGQNLQMANRIIRVDLPWNPGNYEQSIARSYRLPPKDPDAARYSTIYVDLILCEGTAELTKLARMVSKMHAVRQFISGYQSSARFKVVGMSIENMQNVNTFSSIQRHIDVFREMRDFEVEESRIAPKVYGTDTRALATGQEMPDSAKIETPFVDSDLERSPWRVKPSSMKKGVINPKLLYFNGGYWLTMEYLDGMKFMIQGLAKMETESILSCLFKTARDGFLLLEQLREKGIHVVNQAELHRKITGEIPVDPAFPQSRIDYTKLVRVASTPAELPNLREGDQTSKQILAYNPSQEDLKTARELLKKAAPGRELTDIHVLAAAKVLGLFRLNPATIDLMNFSRQTKRFTIFNQNRKILQDQLSPAVESPATSAPEAQISEEEQGDTEIPGLETTPSPTGIPLQLDVSIIGKITSGKLVTSPAFIIQDTSAFLAPGKMDQALKVLQGAGFQRKDSSLRWLFLGENRAQAKSRLEDFSRLVYVKLYTIGNWDEYLQILRNVGCSEAEIEKIFPKEELTAMTRMAQVLSTYPEYEALTRSIFSL